MLRAFLDAFWNESVWLPPNTTWADLAPAPDKKVVYTDYRHLLLTIPMALAFIAVRCIVSQYVFAPFGRSIGIKDGKNKKPTTIPKLEDAYRKNTILKQICALAKQLDMSERQVERWWRLRRSQDKPSRLAKFYENAWRCTFYMCNFSYGLVILWDKDWLWDIDYAFIGYPHQGITNDVWWYYMINFAFYSSLAISHFWDVRRKDFWPMFVHHLVATTLLHLSWVCNFHRIGTLVLLIHDSADVFLEAAKTMKSAGYQRFCDCIFAVFIVLWIVTRLGIYPFHVIGSLWSSVSRLFPMFPACHIFNVLLCALLLLHIIWTWLIVQVAYRTIKAGKVEADIRSSSSDVSDSDCLNDSTPGRVNNKKDTGHGAASLLTATTATRLYATAQCQ